MPDFLSQKTTLLNFHHKFINLHTLTNSSFDTRTRHRHIFFSLLRFRSQGQPRNVWPPPRLAEGLLGHDLRVGRGDVALEDVELLVLAQVGRLRVPRPAVAAHVALAQVDLFVRAHVVSEAEGLAAVPADVRLDPRVADLVPAQLLDLLEALPAGLALEGPLVGVVHHVDVELLPGRALHAANLALHVLELFQGADLESVSEANVKR